MTLDELEDAIARARALGLPGDTPVMISDDRMRNDAFDPCYCYELVSVGPGEYSRKHIPYSKYKEKKAAGADVRCETSDAWATPRVKLMSGGWSGVNGGDFRHKTVFSLMNRETPYRRRQDVDIRR